MKNTKILVMTALFTALTCIATMIIMIPSPLGGYVNLGDVFVLLGSFILGPLPGAIAAALGSAMADVLAGYVIYAPGTFVIKGLMALLTGYAFRRLDVKTRAALAVKASVSSLLGEIVMVLGYLLYESVILGFGWAAAVNVPANSVQALAGIAGSTALFLALANTPYIRKILHRS